MTRLCARSGAVGRRLPFVCATRLKAADGFNTSSWDGTFSFCIPCATAGLYVSWFCLWNIGGGRPSSLSSIFPPGFHIKAAFWDVLAKGFDLRSPSYAFLSWPPKGCTGWDDEVAWQSGCLVCCCGACLGTKPTDVLHVHYKDKKRKFYILVHMLVLVSSCGHLHVPYTNGSRTKTCYTM